LAAGAALAVATASIAAMVPTAAGAAPIDQKKKEAAALEAEINANGEQLGVLYEQIKAAQDKLDTANQTIADTQVRIAAAQSQTDELLTLVRHRAASVYRRAGVGGDDTIFDTDP